MQANNAPSSDGAEASLREMADNTSSSGANARTEAIDALVDKLEGRIQGLERQGRRMRYLLVIAALLLAFVVADQFFPASVIVRQTLMESEEVKLVDTSGNTRLFLRMYSRVPVLQLLDSNGKPRMSLGLRFDDTPFIDLSDKTGRTRATFEMTEDDEPTLKLFNDKGEVSFAIN